MLGVLPIVCGIVRLLMQACSISSSASFCGWCGFATRTESVHTQHARDGQIYSINNLKQNQNEKLFSSAHFGEWNDLHTEGRR